MSSNSWLKFVRHYGPIPRNDNMYDETILRSARRAGITPIEFEHPMQSRVIQCFDKTSTDPVSVILTGTAGDGKTHLCRQVWRVLHGNDEEWASDSPYLTKVFLYPKDRKAWPDSKDASLFRSVKIHFIRDLSGWAPQQGAEWDSGKEQLLQRFCHSLFDADANEVFLIAANDGQLIESWRRLRQSSDVQRAGEIFEDLLVEDRQEREGVRLKFFNLSRTSSAELFDRAIQAFLDHSGWEELKQGIKSENDLFGTNCPIRHNYTTLFRSI